MYSIPVSEPWILNPAAGSAFRSCHASEATHAKELMMKLQTKGKDAHPDHVIL